MTNYLDDFIFEMKVRNYSIYTIKTYSNILKKYILFSKESKLNPIERMKEFLKDMPGTEYKRQVYIAIKLFYKFVVKRDCPYTIEKIKKRKKLPTVLNRGEVLSILNVIKNKKHKLIISMIYGSGLRVSEVTRINVGDLDLFKKIVFIKNAKGMKDRYTI